MKYMALYLAAGVVVLVVTTLQNRLDRKKHGPSLRHSLTELKLQRAFAWQRLLHKVIVPVLAGILVILIWPIALFMLIRDALAGGPEKLVTPNDESVVSEQDLLEKLSIEQIEKREMVDDPLGAAPNKPFGHLHLEWQRFREGLQPDDELWAFRTTYATDWDGIETRTGYVVRRHSELGQYFTSARTTCLADPD